MTYTSSLQPPQLRPKNGEVKTPAWQKPILKTLVHAGKAHWLAQGKLVDRIVKENLKWVPFTQLANITGLPATVCSVILE